MKSLQNEMLVSNLEKFEETIHYQFRKKDLLTRALTHRSYHRNNNERLEFLGDSVLGFLIADALCEKFVKAAEGDLTRMRARLVRGSTLAVIAREIQMSEYILLGEGELKSGGFDRDSILADALEAVLGAIYLDGGLESLRKVVNRLFSDRLETITPSNIKDNKTRLQELLQKNDKPLPVYEVVSQSGKPHNLLFKVSCAIDHADSPFTAGGTSRRRAEQEAANLAINALTGSGGPDS